MKIAMVSVFVDDPHKALEFYTRTLGFQVHTYQPEHNLAIVVSPEEPQGTALLLEPNEKPFAREYQQRLYESGLPAIVFSVPDVKATYTALVQAGVTFVQPPTRTLWGMQAVFDDTCGNLILLHQADG